MSTNPFEKAARKKIRFDFMGTIQTEDLFDLNKTQLDELYQKLTSENALSGESLLQKNKNPDHQLKIDLVRHVFETKQSEEEAAKKRAKNRERREKIKQAMEEKEQGDLKSKDLDELRNMLNQEEEEEEEEEERSQEE